jgi:hypothetical protein
MKSQIIMWWMPLKIVFAKKNHLRTLKFLRQLTLWNTVSEQMSQKEVNTTKYNELKAVFIEQLQQKGLIYQLHV